MAEIANKILKRRILELSRKLGLSHIGSCLTAVDIIDKIFSQKKPDEKFILSSGHAGLALYVVLEKYLGKDAEKIFHHHSVHPDRCEECSIDCSAGSLGNGLPIAVGMALADRSRNVYCLISDGECAEGSIMETLRIAKNVDNLKIYVNYNGWGAYDMIEKQDLYKRLLPYWNSNIEVIETDSSYLPFLKDQDAHYHVMTEDEDKLGMEILK